MSETEANVSKPIQETIKRMNISVRRLQALADLYPDLMIKQDHMRDIYQSVKIWREADSLEIIESSNILSVMPYKEVRVVYDYDFEVYSSDYRIYTNPMYINLVGSRYEGEKVLVIKDYLTQLGTNLYSDKLLKHIEYQLYSFLKRTILSDPEGYIIENDHFLPEKIQTLITFT